MGETLRVGIVGAGRMGRIRALSAKAHPRCRVIQVVDAVAERAESLAREVECEAGTGWESLIARRDIDAVVVATPHKFLAAAAAAAVRSSKHVFCEKPMARNAAEAEAVLVALDGEGSMAASSRPAFVVGFTLRHHPAVVQAKKLLTAGAIGTPFYARGRYGHGGRPGYDKEWRADPELAGGGELLDQGVHLIDLSRWFLGDFQEVTGYVSTFFWRGKGDTSQSGDGTPVGECVEDNAFMLLRAGSGMAASLHASWTQWKNLFSFEVFGREGSLAVEGLGGNYGPERLIVTRRQPGGGAPEVEETAFDDDQSGSVSFSDRVWASEWAGFVAASAGDEAGGVVVTESSANSTDGWEALRIVEGLYRASREGTAVRLDRKKPGRGTR